MAHWRYAIVSCMPQTTTTAPALLNSVMLIYVTSISLLLHLYNFSCIVSGEAAIEENYCVAVVYSDLPSFSASLTENLSDHLLCPRSILEPLMDDWQLNAVTVVRLERLKSNTCVICLGYA